MGIHLRQKKFLIFFDFHDFSPSPNRDNDKNQGYPILETKEPPVVSWGWGCPWKEIENYCATFWIKFKKESPLIWRENKPSLCSGSCDEIHATTKSQNKTYLKLFLKFSLYTLDTFLNTRETSVKHLPWNSHETIFELLLDTLEAPVNHPGKSLGAPLNLAWNTLKISLKPLWHTFETFLKHPLNVLKHHWNPLKTPLIHPSIFLETRLKLSWNTLWTS